MTRLRLSLSVIMSVTIATLVLLPGIFVRAEACPFKDSGMPLKSTLGQPNAVNNPFNKITSASDQRSLFDDRFDYRDVAGFGVVAALFAIALFYKAQHGRATAPGEADLLSRYPQLEHPEMLLALVPKEALSSTFDTDILITR